MIDAPPHARAGADEPVELITLKVVGRGLPDVPRAALAAAAELPEGVVIAQPLRRAYFGPAHGWCDTDIINRADLGEPRAGPCIIEEYDSTCVVPPGSTANLDPFGNIVIDLRAPLPWPSEGEQFDAPFNSVCRHAAGLRRHIARWNAEVIARCRIGVRLRGRSRR